jgi:hypothetical protein
MRGQLLAESISPGIVVTQKYLVDIANKQRSS